MIKIPWFPLLLLLLLAGCGFSRLALDALNPFYNPVADLESYMAIDKFPERFETLSDKIVFRDGSFVREKTVRNTQTHQKTVILQGIQIGHTDEVLREDLIFLTGSLKAGGQVRRRRPEHAIEFVSTPTRPFISLGKIYYQGKFPPNPSAAKTVLRDKAYYHYGADALMGLAVETRAFDDTEVKPATLTVDKYVEYSAIPIAYE